MSKTGYQQRLEEIDEVLDGVRAHLKKIILVYIIGVAIGWPLSIIILRKLIQQGLSMSENLGVELIQTRLLEIILLNTKIALVFGFFFVLPLLVYYGYHAANKRIDRLDLELNLSKKQIIVMVFLAIVLFICGAMYAYFLMVPITVKMFSWWSKKVISEQISNFYSVGPFISLILLLIFAFGFTFELPIVVNLSIRSGLVSHKTLKSKRRHIYVVLLVLSGVITGPNVITQIMVAVPLIAFFEVGLYSGKRMKGS